MSDANTNGVAHRGEQGTPVKMRPGHPWAGNTGRIVADPTAPDGSVKVLLDNGMSCYAWPGHYRRVAST